MRHNNKTTKSILFLFIDLLSHIKVKRKRQFFILLLLMVLSALADVITIGAVVPFISALISPEYLTSNNFFTNFFDQSYIDSPSQVRYLLIFLFLTVAFFAMIIKIILLWLNIRFSYAVGSELGIEIYRKTLYQPYIIHLSRNSSEIISAITNKVGATVNIIGQVLTFLSSLILLVVLGSIFAYVNPLVALICFVGFGGAYALLAFTVRKRLRNNGKRIATEQVNIIKALQEGLGGIRDVILNANQSLYCDLYKRSDRPLRTAQGNSDFIGVCPRYVMETFGIAIICLVALFLSDRPDGFTKALPFLAAIALAAQRILPACQQTYGSWSTIKSLQSQVETTLMLLDQPILIHENNKITHFSRFGTEISFINLSYKYPEQDFWAVDNVSLTIPKGAKVAIVGNTGSGKSTLIDLLMGLLEPTRGLILVDGKPLSEYGLINWQRDIAHVPQVIFLVDGTITENIALGIPVESIDMKRVYESAKQAELLEFINSRPDGFETIVGERGIKLSGGQRQRIGIARALYKNATLLVLDEATSALDNTTERYVIDAIEKLDSNLTIVLIAHRLTTVKWCNLIIELENGRVVNKGTFDELFQASKSFRHMVNLSKN